MTSLPHRSGAGPVPHPQGRTGLHDRRQLIFLTAADELDHGRRADEDFPDDVDPSLPFQAALGQDGLQYHGQAAADFLLGLAAIGTGQAAHSLCCRRRVQCRQDEVPRLGGRQSRIHGGPVAHLADKDDVRILA